MAGGDGEPGGEDERHHGLGGQAEQHDPPDHAPDVGRAQCSVGYGVGRECRDLTVDGTAQVAGRDAYKLVVQPRQSGSTVGAISIAVDHRTGMPLKFTLTPSSGGSAVVDVGFTKVDFGKPSASTFDFTPPKGARIVDQKALGGR